MRKSVFLKSWYWDMLNRLNGDNVKAVLEALFDESKAGGLSPSAGVAYEVIKHDQDEYQRRKEERKQAMQDRDGYRKSYDIGWKYGR